MIRFAGETWAQLERWLIQLARQPFQLAVTLLQPVLFLVLFTGLFSRIVADDLKGAGYLSFILPGILALTVFNNSMFSGVALIFYPRATPVDDRALRATFVPNTCSAGQQCRSWTNSSLLAVCLARRLQHQCRPVTDARGWHAACSLVGQSRVFRVFGGGDRCGLLGHRGQLERKETRHGHTRSVFPRRRDQDFRYRQHSDSHVWHHWRFDDRKRAGRSGPLCYG